MNGQTTYAATYGLVQRVTFPFAGITLFRFRGYHLSPPEGEHP